MRERKSPYAIWRPPLDITQSKDRPVMVVSIPTPVFAVRELFLVVFPRIRLRVAEFGACRIHALDCHWELALALVGRSSRD